ncbi:uncharacterized protein [Drosophila takahashii]|uniref:uncharacterized protein n=1 Tax=Drosophila takahashii TaxID=29030 RepID=UPI001CF86F71|nr:uncharacterized protein LOC123003362 [Drosophila takahashii]
MLFILQQYLKLDLSLQGLRQPSTTIDWRLVLLFLPFFFAFLAQIFHAHIAILNARPAAVQGAGNRGRTRPH